MILKTTYKSIAIEHYTQVMETMKTQEEEWILH